jgi:DNA modification methylase
MEEYELSNGVIHRGDCLDGLRELAEDAITLGFTSPPYFNAVNYEEHVEKVHGNTDHWEREEMSYDDYQDFLIKRFEEVFRVTRPGGHTIVNISPVHWEDERVALPFHLVGWMEDIGWTFKEDIIWEKPVAKDRRSGVLLQNPYPGYYYPSVVAEYVLVFQKEADDENKNNIYWNRTEEEKRRMK